MYYPCHDINEDEPFNCLFCYCPLYSMGEKCGGNFQYARDGKLKLCQDCKLPHTPEYYNVIVDILTEQGR